MQVMISDGNVYYDVTYGTYDPDQLYTGNFNLIICIGINDATASASSPPSTWFGMLHDLSFYPLETASLFTNGICVIHRRWMTHIPLVKILVAILADARVYV